MSHNPALPGAGDATTPTRVRVVAEDSLIAGVLSDALTQVEGVCVVGDAGQADVVLWDAGAAGRGPATPGAVAAGRAEAAAESVVRAGRQPVRSSQLQGVAGGAGRPVVALVRDDVQAAQLLAAGARGVVLRQAGAVRMASALVAARHGLCVIDLELSSALLPPRAEDGADPDEPALTAREHEVLALMAAGLSNKTIARRLDVSVHTVKFHVNSILGKLVADTRTAAVAKALRRGLLAL